MKSESNFTHMEKVDFEDNYETQFILNIYLSYSTARRQGLFPSETILNI